MKRLVATVVAVGAAVAAVAMPTKAELQKAQAMVSDVTAADVAALKTKSKKPAEVAAKHMELAGEAGNEAEKYVLLQGAFKLYAKAGDYEGAANALAKMNREISDMNPEVIVEIYNKAIFGSMKEKAPKLHAIKEAARRQVSFRKQLTKAEFAAKANPKDTAAQKRLGECYAEIGNWPKALDAFSLAGGGLAKTAEAEKAGTSAPQVSGDFWWDYESGDEMSTYKLHAAELYRKALADGSFKGLARTRAEQRVKEADKVAVDLPKMSGGKVDDFNPMLVHRWSFNKDFVDSVGKAEAKKLGRSVKLENGQCVVRKGGLDLGGSLREVGIPFTVEFWYAELGKEEDNFIFRTDGLKIRGQKSNYGVQWENYGRQYDFVQLQANHRVYFAVTYDGRQGTAYVCDMDGDKRLNKLSKESASIPFDGENLFLGGCAREENKYPSGKYDEIRIWKTALSMDDIEKSCNAGPDNVPAVTGAKSTGDEDGDYICFVSSSKADWSVSDTEPDKKWLGLGFHDVLQWKVVHGAYRADKENSTKWLRTKANWELDPKLIEKAEIEYMVDGKATVWLNGKDLADLGHGASPQNRDDITESFIKAISVGRNVLAVKFTNNGGKGVCDIGICVRLAKKPLR